MWDRSRHTPLMRSISLHGMMFRRRGRRTTWAHPRWEQVITVAGLMFPTVFAIRSVSSPQSLPFREGTGFMLSNSPYGKNSKTDLWRVETTRRFPGRPL